jgi:hypothetical protein
LKVIDTYHLFAGIHVNFKFQSLSRFIPAFLILASVSCVWQLKEEPKPLLLALAANQPDTVSILPSIKCFFSEPIQESSVHLQFSPNFFDYYVLLNAAQDSLTIVITQPLLGNTRYVIRLAQPINSKNGATLTANEDSLVIVSAVMEREPNNSKNTSDTLHGWIEGIISTSSDTDYYYCNCSAGDTLFLSSVNTVSAFQAIDSPGTATPSLHYGLLMDSLIIPSSAILPIFVKVFAAYRSSGGYYDLRK